MFIFLILGWQQFTYKDNKMNWMMRRNVSRIYRYVLCTEAEISIDAVHENAYLIEVYGNLGRPAWQALNRATFMMYSEMGVSDDTRTLHWGDGHSNRSPGSVYGSPKLWSRLNSGR